MKGRTISIRLSDAEMYRLDQIMEMRKRRIQKGKTLLPDPESVSDIIRLAILRFYNDTFEYFIYEDEEMYKKLPEE